LLSETSVNVKELRKNNEIKKILSELMALKENIAKNSNNYGNISTKMENQIILIYPLKK